MTNRGCVLEEEIKKIIATEAPNELPRVDEFVAFVTGKNEPETKADRKIRDKIKAEIREPRPIAKCGKLNRQDDLDRPSGQEATGDDSTSEPDCRLSEPRWYSDDLAARGFDYLGAIVSSHVAAGFTNGLNWGADTLTDLAATGPAVQGLLLLAFAALIAAPIGTLGWQIVKRAFGRSGVEGKQKN